MDKTPKDKPEPNQFEKMRELTKRVLAVPKGEIDRQEKEGRKAKIQHGT